MLEGCGACALDFTNSNKGENESHAKLLVSIAKYAGVPVEARAVRETVGFADVSQLGKLELQGVIKGYRNSETVEQTLDAMKKAAGQRGLDGIREVVCMDPGAVGSGNCTAMGFIYVP